MDTLSVRAAARHLDIAEKTIRRWIASEKLPATRDARGQYLIEREDLEAMSIQVSIPVSTQHATDVQTRLDQIEQRLDVLEAQQQRTKPVQPTLPSMPAPQQPTRQKAASTSLDAIQPEGTITLQDLADQLSMPRRSLLDHIQRRNLEHIAIPHPSRAGEMKRYFTDDQVKAVRQALNK